MLSSIRVNQITSLDVFLLLLANGLDDGEGANRVEGDEDQNVRRLAPGRALGCVGHRLHSGLACSKFDRVLVTGCYTM